MSMSRERKSLRQDEVPSTGIDAGDLLFLDLELTRSGELKRGGALFGYEELAAAGGPAFWADLGRLAGRAAGVAGHNLIDHDLRWVREHRPGHPLLDLPAVDTLWLSPLAFPERPYHFLLKEDQLLRDSLPDPVADCRACRRVLATCLDELRRRHERAPALIEYQKAALCDPGLSPGAAAFRDLLPGPTLSPQEAWDLLRERLEDRACATALAELAPARDQLLPLAYLSAWLSVDTPGSVVPFWVARRFPAVSALARRLRSEPCEDPDCAWCERRRDPRTLLRQWWGFDDFRPEPALPGGGSVQRALVEAGLRGEPFFGIMPTGGGKSICFQLPAILRHRDLGQLTVVLSPLQSLMKDQVDHLVEQDPHATAIYGALSLLERRARLREVRDGHADLLYLAPEQLRNPSVRGALEVREIGAWVFDEAHCLSKWGHDFRPDYLYAPRFIRELAEAQGVPVPPVQCFTATARREVIEEIRRIFAAEVGQELRLFPGGGRRPNLSFQVEQVPAPDKPARIAELIEEHLGDRAGACVVFAATRDRTEQIASYLNEHALPARAYHAGLDGETRREVQDQFLGGGLRVICATSAFGMGVDKPDIRLVIHHDVPGSLESYLQQAGRAGRDGDPALCVLLFQPGDIDTQFRLDGYSRLEFRDLQALWRAVRAVPHHLELRREGGVECRIISAGELIRLEAARGVFDPGDPRATDRVGTAVRWLERSGVVRRDENRTTLFSGRPAFPGRDQAREKVLSLPLSPPRRDRWLRILDQLYEAADGDGLVAEDLAEVVDPDGDPLESGREVLRTLYDMAKEGVVTSGQQCLVLMREGVRDSSTTRLRRWHEVEQGLLGVFEEEAPDADGEWATVRPRTVTRRLPELGLQPPEVRRVVRSLADLAQGLAADARCAEVRSHGEETLRVKLRRPWPEVRGFAEVRRDVTSTLLAWLRGSIPEGERGSGVAVAFTVEDAAGAVEADLALRGRVRSPFDATTHALLWMDRTRVLKLQNGLAVFRQAMTLRRCPDGRTALSKDRDYAPLEHHYGQRTIQIHVMDEYAKRGARDMVVAERLAADWFEQPGAEFLNRYFRGRRAMLERATSQESWQRIVESLGNREQERIVTSSPDRNALVLAGPGSGKTRVLVHRVAWLLRVRRVRPSSILVLCYTRANALEVRRRLTRLAGSESRRVSVMTLHGLALRMVGTMPDREAGHAGFAALLRRATSLLTGDEPLPGVDRSQARDELLRGYRHILIDEYQDLDGDQYDLLSAVAGRTENDPEAKLTIFAVGDDDQNIYTFRGASARYLRRFEADYRAHRYHLLENFRSTGAILEAATSLLDGLPDRMKAGEVLRVADRRRDEPRGGRLEALDPVSGGRVRRVALPSASQLGLWIVAEIRRLLALDPEASPSDVAVLSARRAGLAPVRLALESLRRTGEWIPFAWPLPSQTALPLGRVREVVEAHEAIDGLDPEGATPAELIRALEARLPGDSPWRDLVLGFGDELRQRYGGKRLDPGKLGHLLWEATTTARREQMIGSGVHLGTLHGAKGLEFRHVIIADDGLGGAGGGAARRLLYVGLTRAREGLTICVRSDRPHPLLGQIGSVVDVAAPEQPGELPPRAYDLLHPGHLWIDFAGRKPAGHEVHRALEALPFGASLKLVERGRHLYLADRDGVFIARLTDKAKEDWSRRSLARFKLIALERRTRKMSGEEYGARLRVDSWYVPWCEARWEREAPQDQRQRS